MCIDVILQGKQLVTTLNEECRSNPVFDLTSLAPCSHEEGDTRVMLHVAAASSEGHRRILIRTVDSDVVVLGIKAIVLLRERIDELWIGFGSGHHFR